MSLPHRLGGAGRDPPQNLWLTHASPPWVKPLYPTLGRWIPPLVVLPAAWESFSYRTWWHQEP